MFSFCIKLTFLCPSDDMTTLKQFVGLFAPRVGLPANQTWKGKQSWAWRSVHPSLRSLPAQKRAEVVGGASKDAHFFFFVKRAFQESTENSKGKNGIRRFPKTPRAKHRGWNGALKFHRSKPLKVVPKLWPWELSPCFTAENEWSSMFQFCGFHPIQFVRVGACTCTWDLSHV